MQDSNHLPPHLDIQDCNFFFIQSGEDKSKRKEIKYTAKVAQNIKTVYLEFNENAIKKGASVTQPSKIIRDLPIKVHHFKPLNHMKVDPDLKLEEDIFGKR